MTVTVDNLVFSGIHGLTHKEKQASQRFGIDITATGGSCRPAATDLIANALDYRALRSAAALVVETEQHCLLERVADRIAMACLNETSATAVTVRIRKLDIWDNGIPGVVVTRTRLPNHFNLLDFDIDEVLDRIIYDGAAAVPILPDARRRVLLEEAEHYHLVEQPKELAGGKVHEEVSSIRELPPSSLFWRLKSDFTELLRWKLGPERWRYYFPSPELEFSELSLQRYDQGSLGITPHHDGRSMLNLICIFTLVGQAKFGLCDDRDKANARYLDTTPGNVTIMRGPGFMGSTFQPFHFVSDVTERRIVFGLRQKGGER